MPLLQIPQQLFIKSTSGKMRDIAALSGVSKETRNIIQPELSEVRSMMDSVQLQFLINNDHMFMIDEYKWQIRVFFTHGKVIGINTFLENFRNDIRIFFNKEGYITELKGELKGIPLKLRSRLFWIYYIKSLDEAFGAGCDAQAVVNMMKKWRDALLKNPGKYGYGMNETNEYVGHMITGSYTIQDLKQRLWVDFESGNINRKDNIQLIYLINNNNNNNNRNTLHTLYDHEFMIEEYKWMVTVFFTNDPQFLRITTIFKNFHNNINIFFNKEGYITEIKDMYNKPLDRRSQLVWVYYIKSLDEAFGPGRDAQAVINMMKKWRDALLKTPGMNEWYVMNSMITDPGSYKIQNLKQKLYIIKSEWKKFDYNGPGLHSTKPL